MTVEHIPNTDQEWQMLRPLLVDEMTSLYTHSYLVERIRDDMLRSRRYGWPTSLILLEIDQLDDLLKNHGTVAVDHVCATLADMFGKIARDTDLAGRFDRGKFCLLMPGTNQQGAMTFAERLRDRVATTPFGDSRKFSVTVTCSIGIVQHGPEYESATGLMSACDAALRASLDAGGNTIRVAKSGSPA